MNQQLEGAPGVRAQGSVGTWKGSAQAKATAAALLLAHSCTYAAGRSELTTGA